MAAPTEFTLFPKFPIELRTKIFKHALPTGPNGVRLLRVSADQLVTTTNTTTEKRVDIKTLSTTRSKPAEAETISYLTFELLEHQHRVLIKDVGMLGACSESRGVYLKYFTQILKTADGGLIRFAKDDIVYITNMDEIAELPEFLEVLQAGNAFQEISCHKLALPSPCFSEGWFDYWLPASEAEQEGGSILEFILQCKDVKEVGLVWNDIGACIGVERYVIKEERADREGDDPLKSRGLDDVNQLGSNWENCKELRGQKLPELVVWEFDGKRVTRQEASRQAL